MGNWSCQLDFLTCSVLCGSKSGYSCRKLKRPGQTDKGKRLRETHPSSWISWQTVYHWIQVLLMPQGGKKRPLLNRTWNESCLLEKVPLLVKIGAPSPKHRLWRCDNKLCNPQTIHHNALVIYILRWCWLSDVPYNKTMPFFAFKWEPKRRRISTTTTAIT